jgi:peroxiredoxin
MTVTQEEKGGPTGLLILIGVGALMGVLMAVLTITGSDSVRSVTSQSVENAPTPAPDVVRVGQPAPGFTLETLSGEEASLVDFRGSVVAVNFWATWCGPCRAEMPALQAASDEFDELVILGVNTGESRSRVAGFMEELGLTFPALLDTNEDVADLYGVRAMPTTVWVDPDGIVRFEHFGPLTENQIERYVVSVMEGE